jgi:hypothetical protein
MNTISDQTQLTLVQRTIQVPGAQLNLRGLVIDNDITHDQLLRVGSHLGAVSGVLQWAWADYLCALSDHTCGGADDAETLCTYCDQHAIPSKTRRELTLLGRFYAQGDRLIPLPYEYYREAFLMTRGAKPKALKYLATADADQMGLGEFRRHIRKAEADPSAPARQSVFADYTVVFDFCKFAKAQLETEIENYSAERAIAILADLADGIAFIEKLREISKSEKTETKPAKFSQ